MNDNLKTLYQVWHRGPAGFSHAFTVHAADLTGALVLPMIEPRMAGVSERTPDPRPTTFGDVIVTPERDAYEVAETRHGVTFDLIDFPPARVGLLAEQREEALAGAADGLRAGGRLSEIMREGAAYGLKPEEVAELGREQGEERER